MKKLFKLTVLSGLALGVFAVTPAQARENESCFSQKTVSGWVRVCSENDGGFEFNIGTYGDRRNDRRGEHYQRPAPVKQVVYYYPVGYFVPPGHHKQDWHHKYRKPGKDKEYKHHKDRRDRHEHYHRH